MRKTAMFSAVWAAGAVLAACGGGGASDGAGLERHRIFTPGDVGARALGAEVEGIGDAAWNGALEGEAGRAFVRGLNALHNATYADAETQFRRARELAPDFALAYWGEAMAHERPEWTGSDTHDRDGGKDALRAWRRHAAREGVSPAPEHAPFLAAAETLFDGDGTLAQRRRAYASAACDQADRDRGDREADIACAAAQLAMLARPSREADLVEPISARLEPIVKALPGHPGARRHLLRVYATPDYAARGQTHVGGYAEIAPQTAAAALTPYGVLRSAGDYAGAAAAAEAAYDLSVRWADATGRGLAGRDFHAATLAIEALALGGQVDAAAQRIAALNALSDQARGDGSDLSADLEAAAFVLQARLSRWTSGSFTVGPEFAAPIDAAPASALAFDVAPLVDLAGREAVLAAVKAKRGLSLPGGDDPLAGAVAFARAHVAMAQAAPDADLIGADLAEAARIETLHDGVAADPIVARLTFARFLLDQGGDAAAEGRQVAEAVALAYPHRPDALALAGEAALSAGDRTLAIARFRAVMDVLVVSDSPLGRRAQTLAGGIRPALPAPAPEANDEDAPTDDGVDEEAADAQLSEG